MSRRKGTRVSLGAIGITVSLSYLVLLAVVANVLVRTGTIATGKMSLSEFGNLLSTVLGPIGILWVVLGFFQQGKELNHSVEALTLQAEELKNSVEQQTIAATTNRQLLEVEKSRIEDERNRRVTSEQGLFIVGHAGSYANENSELEQYIDVVNLGNAVGSFGFFHGPGVTPVKSDFHMRPEMEYPVWERHVGRRYTFTLEEGRSSRDADLELSYANADGSVVDRRFRFLENNNSPFRSYDLVEMKTEDFKS